MKDIRILHFGDWHLRPLDRHDEYRVVFKDLLSIAKKKNVDFVFFGGDLIHEKLSRMTPELIGEIHWMLTELNNLPGEPKTFITLGNHDGNLANREMRDYVSPIVKACNLKNIVLCKESKNYKINEDVNLCLFSVFDKKGWSNVSPDHEKVNIAAYHGPVAGCSTEMGYVLDGDVDVEFFEDYDYTLLADIHKRQFLNKEKTIGYCGSTIQQNFGETVDEHGVLVWSIRGKNDFDVEFIQIENRIPFITIDWQGSVKKTVDEHKWIKKKSRLRVMSEKQLTDSDKSILDMQLKAEFDPVSLVYELEKIDHVFDDSVGSEVQNTKDLLSVNTLKEMVEDFYEDDAFCDDQRDVIEQEIADSLENIAKKDDSFANRFQIERIEFSNLFGYGEDNFINFGDLKGVVGVFAPNRFGKSTILAAVLYSIFGDLDREAGQGKNHFLINLRAKKATTKAFVKIGESRILITREAERKTKKNCAKVSLKEQVKFFLVDENYQIKEDLSGEKPSQTNKEISKYVGTAEDFLLTTISAQDDMKKFLKNKNTSRKQILSRFLSLEVLEKMHLSIRAKNTDCKNQIKLMDIKDWETIISNLKEEKVDLEKKIEKLNHRESLISEEWVEVKAELQNIAEASAKIVSVKDVELLREGVVKTESSIVDLKEALNKGKRKYKETLKKVEEFDADSIAIEIDELESEVEKLRVEIDDLREVKVEMSFLEREVKGKEKTILKLKTVPCGDQYPNCKYISDAHMAKKELAEIKNRFEKVEEKVKNLQSANNEKKLKDSKVKIANLKGLQNENQKNLFFLEQGKDRLLSEKSKLDLLKDRLEEQKERLRKAEASAINIEETTAIQELKKREEEILSSMKSIKSHIAEYQQRMGKIEEVVKHSIADMEKYSILNKKSMALEKLVYAFSPKGFPSQLLSQKLKIINQEISHVLSGVVDFDVELEIQDGTDKLEVMLNYKGNKRPIEVCSGMERNVASIAIRVAMVLISSMPKTNMLMFDEAFDAFDANSIDVAEKIFFSLRRWFKSIFIISHDESVKNMAEKHIDIIKNGLDSFVGVN